MEPQKGGSGNPTFLVTVLWMKKTTHIGHAAEMWEGLQGYGHICYLFLRGNILAYIQKQYKDLHSCRDGATLASRLSHAGEGGSLSLEVGALPWVSSGRWAGRPGNQAQVSGSGVLTLL